MELLKRPQLPPTSVVLNAAGSAGGKLMPINNPYSSLSRPGTAQAHGPQPNVGQLNSAKDGKFRPQTGDNLRITTGHSERPSTGITENLNKSRDAIEKLIRRLPREDQDEVTQVMLTLKLNGDGFKRTLAVRQAQMQAMQEELTKLRVEVYSLNQNCDVYKARIKRLESDHDVLQDTMVGRQKYAVRCQRAMARLYGTNRLLIDSLEALQATQGPIEDINHSFDQKSDYPGGAFTRLPSLGDMNSEAPGAQPVKKGNTFKLAQTHDGVSRNAKLRESLLKIAREHYRSVKKGEILEKEVEDMRRRVRVAEQASRLLQLELDELRSRDDTGGGGIRSMEQRLTGNQKQGGMKHRASNKFDDRLRELIVQRQVVDPLEAVLKFRKIVAYMATCPGSLHMGDVAKHIASREIMEMLETLMICLFVIAPNKPNHLLKYTPRSEKPEVLEVVDLSLVAEVMKRGQVARVNNMKHIHFDVKVDGCPGLVVKNVLSLPLRDTSDKVFGALHLLNKANNDVFGDIDELFAMVFADQSASSLAGCLTFQHAQYRADTLENLLDSSLQLFTVLPEDTSSYNSHVLTPSELILRLEEVTKATLRLYKCRAFLLSSRIRGMEGGHLVFLSSKSEDRSRHAAMTVEMAPLISGVAGFVASTKTWSVTQENETNVRANPQVDIDPIGLPQVTMPVVDLRGGVIAVLQMVLGVGSPILRTSESRDDGVTFVKMAHLLSYQLSAPLQFLIDCIGQTDLSKISMLQLKMGQSFSQASHLPNKISARRDDEERADGVHAFALLASFKNFSQEVGKLMVNTKTKTRFRDRIGSTFGRIEHSAHSPSPPRGEEAEPTRGSAIGMAQVVKDLIAVRKAEGQMVPFTSSMSVEAPAAAAAPHSTIQSVNEKGRQSSKNYQTSGLVDVTAFAPLRHQDGSFSLPTIESSVPSEAPTPPQMLPPIRSMGSAGGSGNVGVNASLLSIALLSSDTAEASKNQIAIGQVSPMKAVMQELDSALSSTKPSATPSGSASPRKPLDKISASEPAPMQRRTTASEKGSELQPQQRKSVILIDETRKGSAGVSEVGKLQRLSSHIPRKISDSSPAKLRKQSTAAAKINEISSQTPQKLRKQSSRLGRDIEGSSTQRQAGSIHESSASQTPQKLRRQSSKLAKSSIDDSTQRQGAVDSTQSDASVSPPRKQSAAPPKSARGKTPRGEMVDASLLDEVRIDLEAVTAERDQLKRNIQKLQKLLGPDSMPSKQGKGLFTRGGGKESMEPLKAQVFEAMSEVSSLQKELARVTSERIIAEKGKNQLMRAVENYQHQMATMRTELVMTRATAAEVTEKLSEIEQQTSTAVKSLMSELDESKRLVIQREEEIEQLHQQLAQQMNENAALQTKSVESVNDIAAKDRSVIEDLQQKIEDLQAKLVEQSLVNRRMRGDLCKSLDLSSKMAADADITVALQVAIDGVAAAVSSAPHKTTSRSMENSLTISSISDQVNEDYPDIMHTDGEHGDKPSSTRKARRGRNSIGQQGQRRGSSQEREGSPERGAHQDSHRLRLSTDGDRQASLKHGDLDRLVPSPLHLSRDLRGDKQTTQPRKYSLTDPRSRRKSSAGVADISGQMSTEVSARKSFEDSGQPPSGLSSSSPSFNLRSKHRDSVTNVSSKGKDRGRNSLKRSGASAGGGGVHGDDEVISSRKRSGSEHSSSHDDDYDLDSSTNRLARLHRHNRTSSQGPQKSTRPKVHSEKHHSIDETAYDGHSNIWADLVLRRDDDEEIEAPSKAAANAATPNSLKTPVLEPSGASRPGTPSDVSAGAHSGTPASLEYPWVNSVDDNGQHLHINMETGEIRGPKELSSAKAITAVEMTAKHETEGNIWTDPEHAKENSDAGYNDNFHQGELRCGNWLQHFDAEHNEYWVHAITGESLWELPEGWEREAVLESALPQLPEDLVELEADDTGLVSHQSTYTIEL